jgi:hypothetical protein
MHECLNNWLIKYRQLQAVTQTITGIVIESMALSSIDGWISSPWFAQYYDAEMTSLWNEVFVACDLFCTNVGVTLLCYGADSNKSKYSLGCLVDYPLKLVDAGPHVTNFLRYSNDIAMISFLISLIHKNLLISQEGPTELQEGDTGQDVTSVASARSLCQVCRMGSSTTW